MTAQIKRSYPRCEQLCQQGRVNCSCLKTANSDGSSPHDEIDKRIGFLQFIVGACALGFLLGLCTIGMIELARKFV